MQHPAIQPISFSSSFKCFLVILQALSLSLPKSPNLLHNKTANHTCNATATYSHMQLSRCHLFSTLTTTTKSPSTAMGHRYFNLAMTCDICLRYAHAPMTSQPTCQKVKQNTHHLNQEYSSSSMPLTLHQQCTNLVITSEP